MPSGLINLVKYVAVASPSRFGSVAIMISLICVSASLVINSLILKFSGPTPSIGDIAPPSTWYLMTNLMKVLVSKFFAFPQALLLEASLNTPTKLPWEGLLTGEGPTIID